MTALWFTVTYGVTCEFGDVCVNLQDKCGKPVANFL